MIGFQVTVKNVGNVFLRHTVVITNIASTVMVNLTIFTLTSQCIMYELNVIMIIFINDNCSLIKNQTIC